MTTTGRPVLVTGATGFTGQHLVRRLSTQGRSVRVIARDERRARTMFGPDVEVIAGDVADVDIVGRAMVNVGVVYHLAAAYREAGASVRYREVHVDSTARLLEAAVREGTGRFVHCSTIGVHGHVTSPPADEAAPYSPGDIYQSTKCEGEQLALTFGKAHGLEVAVARPTAIYGPGDTRLLKLFSLIARRRFVMVGSGKPFYHLVHVNDLVTGLELLASHPAAVGEAFILGGEDYRSLNDLAALIASIVGAPRPWMHVPAWPIQWLGSACEAICAPFNVSPPIYRRRVDFFTKSRAFSIAKAKQRLGFAPAIPLERGLRETAEWYRSAGLLPAGRLS